MPVTAVHQLEGRVALVTGGTGALGRSVVRRLAEAGAQVHVTWRNEAETGELRSYLGAGAKGVVLHRVDVTQPAEVASLFEALRADPGRLDILACIAGGLTAAPVEDTAPPDQNTWLKPDEIAEVVAFLASDAAGIVTGSAVNLSRG